MEHRVLRSALTASALVTALTVGWGSTVPLAIGAPINSAAGSAVLNPESPREFNTAPRATRATIERVDWLSTRRVSLTIQSPAMQRSMVVQLLLAKDWNRKPQAKFPTLTLLDGMRASEKENGWTSETNLDALIADKNVTVVMPIGGEASFYTNWIKTPRGEGPIQWETFLTRELRPLLKRDWRATERAGIAGLSMGGTAAVTLAERNPALYGFVGSFSGILDTTSFGMPQAIAAAMGEVKPGYRATDMWGPYGNGNWKAHDPKLGVERLRGKTVYVTSGSGNTGPYDKPSRKNPSIPDNQAGFGLELLSNMTSQTFAARAKKAGVNVVTRFRSVGTHSWPYWQFEFNQALPEMAKALGLPNQRSTCRTGGEIAKATKGIKFLNGCITGEYPVRGGVAQDFRGGRAFWSKKTGAHVVFGAIGSYYQVKGGSSGKLGLPVSGELVAPDGKGRLQRFANGIIYWTPELGAHQVLGDNLKAYGRTGFERGPLGYPIGDETPFPRRKGVYQLFEGGVMYWSKETGSHAIRGAILDKYRSMRSEAGSAGLPLSDEIPLQGGAMSDFEHGKIYWSQSTGARWIPRGKLFDEWGRRGYENGELGWPTSDFTDKDGVRRITFQNGEIRMIDGKVQTKVNGR